MVEICDLKGQTSVMQAMHDNVYGGDSIKDLKDAGPGAIAAYVRVRINGERALDFEGSGGSKWQAFKKDNPIYSVARYRNPSGILGSDYVRPYVDAVQKWHQEVLDSGAEKNIAEQKAIWNDVVKPLADEGKNDLLEGYSNFNGAKLGYAVNYLDDLSKGVDAFGRDGQSNPLMVMAGNLIEKSISNNPKVALLHLFSTRRAVELYGHNGIFAIGRTAFDPAIIKNGYRVPEFERLGIYGKPGGHKVSLTALSDDFVKTVAAYSSKFAGEDNVSIANASRRISLGRQLGDLPEYMRGDGSDTGLLRFSIENYKHLTQATYDAIAGVASRDPKRALKGAGVLVGEAVIMHGLFGQAALVPKWAGMVYNWFNPDRIDNEDKGNLSRWTNGLIDLSDYARPEGVAVGIPYQMLSEDAYGSVKAFKKSIDDPEHAWLDIGDGLLRAGMLHKFGSAGPLGKLADVLTDVNAVHLYQVYNELMHNEIEQNEFLQRYLEVEKVSEAKTYKGMDVEENKHRYLKRLGM